MRFNAWMISLESPKTDRVRRFLLIARLSPYHRARASALLVDSMPSPHWNRNSDDPSGFRRTPPPPIAAGLPFDTFLVYVLI